MSDLNKFDTLVESTLKVYHEFVTLTPQTVSNPTQLTGIEQDAVANAMQMVNTPDQNTPIDPDQARLADLANKRKAQLSTAGKTAIQKLQKTVTQPTTQPVTQPSLNYNVVNPTNR